MFYFLYFLTIMDAISKIFRVCKIGGYCNKKQVDLSDVKVICHVDNIHENFMFNIKKIQQPTIDSCHITSKQIIWQFFNFTPLQRCKQNYRLRYFNLFKFKKQIYDLQIYDLQNIFFSHNGPIIITIKNNFICNHSIVLCGIRNEEIIFFNPWNASFGLITIQTLNKKLAEIYYECA